MNVFPQAFEDILDYSSFSMTLLEHEMIANLTSILPKVDNVEMQTYEDGVKVLLNVTSEGYYDGLLRAVSILF